MNANDYQKDAIQTLMSNAEQAHRIISILEQTPMMAQIIVAGAKLSSESGELNDAIVKHISYGQPLDKLNIKEECGDLLWYIAVISHTLGYKMEDIMKENIDKLKRRYPDMKFSEQHAAARLDKCNQK